VLLFHGSHGAALKLASRQSQPAGSSGSTKQKYLSLCTTTDHTEAAIARASSPPDPERELSMRVCAHCRSMQMQCSSRMQAVAGRTIWSLNTMRIRAVRCSAVQFMLARNYLES
jgi:excinuclease UvrABC ATPase subunit